MSDFSIQSTFEDRYATQQTVDIDNTNSQSVIRNKQVNISSPRRYSPISESSKEDIPVEEIRDRFARQILHGQTDTNSDFNVINEKYSEAYNKLLEMPMSAPNKHAENVAKFVIAALNNQRIDFSSIATAFCKRIDEQSNSNTGSTISNSLVEMVNTGCTDIAAEIIANMVDNGRVDTAEYVFKIISRSADQSYNHTTNIATDSSMSHAIANEGKINVVAKIINQMVYGEYTDNAIKVLVYTIRCLEETTARNIINKISDAKRISIISKLLLRLNNMTFKDHDLSAANELKQMLEHAQNCVRTKIIQDINNLPFFAIADMIVEMINKNDIGFALSIFQAIDQTKNLMFSLIWSQTAEEFFITYLKNETCCKVPLINTQQYCTQLFQCCRQ